MCTVKPDRSYQIQKTGDFFAELHQGGVDSPEKAVKAAIVDEFHKK